MQLGLILQFQKKKSFESEQIPIGNSYSYNERKSSISKREFDLFDSP